LGSFVFDSASIPVSCKSYYISWRKEGNLNALSIPSYNLVISPSLVSLALQSVLGEVIAESAGKGRVCERLFLKNVFLGLDLFAGWMWLFYVLILLPQVQLTLTGPATYNQLSTHNHAVPQYGRVINDGITQGGNVKPSTSWIMHVLSY
jgi:hypothetical protein